MKLRLRCSLAFLALAFAASADAQIGGVIRQKAAEAVRADNEKNKDQGQQKSSLGCEVTDATMDRFIKGLQTEQAERKAAAAELAKAKNQSDYDACQVQLATSEEAQKVMAPMMNMPENISQAEYQKIVAKMNEDMLALLLKRCGPNPSEAAASANRKRADAEKNGAKAAGMGDDCYGRVKEHVTSFCGLSAAIQAQATTEGMRVAGEGKDVWWIFTPGEAKAYKPRCGAILALLKDMP